MTSILQEYAEAYERLFAFINDRDPLLLREFITQDELYQGEQE